MVKAGTVCATEVLNKSNTGLKLKVKTNIHENILTEEMTG